MTPEQTKSLTFSSLALHANTLLSSLVGFGFLVVAARLYDRDDFGRDLALVSAMMMVAAIAETNMGMALVKFLPRLGRQSTPVVLAALVISGIAALVFSLLFVVLAPRLSEAFSYIGSAHLGLAVVFILTVVAWNAFVISDSVLTTIRATTWVPVKNLAFGVAKFIAMLAFAQWSLHHGIFLAWATSLLLLIGPSVWLMFRGPLRRHERRDTSEPLTAFTGSGTVLAHKRDVFRYLSFDYVASIMAQVGTTALPLVVIGTLGSSANAEFMVAFSIVLAVEQLAVNAGVVLTVEGVYDERSFAHLVRHSFVRFGGVLALLVAAGIVLAPVATFLFGDQYGAETTEVLRLLLLGLLPQAVVILYQSVCRVQGRAKTIAVVNTVQALVTIALTVFLADRIGLAGAGWAWVTGHLLVAVVMLPSLLRLMYPR